MGFLFYLRVVTMPTGSYGADPALAREIDQRLGHDDVLQAGAGRFVDADAALEVHWRARRAARSSVTR